MPRKRPSPLPRAKFDALLADYRADPVLSAANIMLVFDTPEQRADYDRAQAAVLKRHRVSLDRFFASMYEYLVKPLHALDTRTPEQAVADYQRTLEMERKK